MKFDESTLYHIKSNVAGIRFPLYNLATWKNGLAFKKIDFSEIGRPIVKIAELNNGISSNTSFTQGEYDKDVFIRWDDLLFSWSGNPQTSIDVFRYRLQDGWLNQHIFKVTPNEELVTKDFLFYVLKSLKPQFTQIATNKQTTGLGHITIADLKRMSLIVPSKHVQNRIVSILKQLDDKIELNNAINENLFRQTCTLFHSMFISSDARQSWERGTFSDLIESTLGGDWGKEYPVGNHTQKVYCIRGSDIPAVKTGNKGKMPTRYIIPKNYATKRLLPGDIVVEISGGSPTQSTGRVAAISQSLLDRYDQGMVCTNFCRAIKPKQGYCMFVYHYWQYLYNRNVFFLYENGTTGIKNLDLTGFINTEEIVLPPATLVEQFDDFCHSLFDQIFALGLENELLSTLRDALLPKLMSGELDVSNLDL